MKNSTQILGRHLLLLVLLCMGGCKWDYDRIPIPDMSITEITNPRLTSAEVHALISNPEDLNAMEYGLVWSLTDDPESADAQVSSSQGLPVSGEFVDTIYNLKINSPYFVWPFITDTENKRIYGKSQIFVAPSLELTTDPFVTTSFSSSVVSAEMIGIVNGIDQSIEMVGAGHVYSQVLPPEAAGATHWEEHGSWVEAEETPLGDGIFFTNISGLMQDETYWVSAYVVAKRIDPFSAGTAPILDTLFTNVVVINPKNSFRPIASFGNDQFDGRGFAVGFCLGDYVYVGTGTNFQPTGSSITQVYFNDFWRYDPEMNVWDQIDALPGPPRAFSVGFAIGDTAYVGLGFGNGMFHDDFYLYNGNGWESIGPFPGGGVQGATSFVIGRKAYVGLGEKFTGSGGEYTTEFYCFDPDAPPNERWSSEIAEFDENMGRLYANGFSIGSKGYVGGGTSGKHRLVKFRQ